MKLDDKGKNILAAVLAVVILWVALTVRFTPELTLGNMLLSMAEMPKNLFQFVWQELGFAEEEPEPPEETKPQKQEEKTQFPLVLFDDTDADYVPIVINPVEGINQLPEDIFPGAEEHD